MNAVVEEQKKGHSGDFEAFFRTDGERGPLIVVHHVQKTAGTSLRRVVRSNLPPSEVERLPYMHEQARLSWHRDWYRALDDGRRARLACVMSHFAGYLLPALDRPADALVLVREPVDRTLSYYWFKQRGGGPGGRPLEPLDQLYERRGSRADGRPQFGVWDQLCNWQSRALLSPFHDTFGLVHSAGPSPDADVWRERLRDLVEHVYLVGVQDRFRDYLELLGRRYHWKIFEPHSKVNPHRPAEEISPELRETILAYNWLDAELYELCRDAINGRRISGRRASRRPPSLYRADAMRHREPLLPPVPVNEVTPAGWKPIVAFVHIPRSGSGSVTRAISRAYGRTANAGNVKLSADKSHRPLQHISENLDAWSGRALADHVPYGLYARYLPADTRYITFVRDPVERVLSHYYFHLQGRQRGAEKMREIWRREDAADVGDEEDVSLEAGLARGITIYTNFATRFLWGGESLEGELPPDALERAKENLARFAFVGVTERLDEGVILLGRMLGVPLAGYYLRHVREGRPKASDVPASLIRLIEQHNPLDIELYRIARERFDAEAGAAGEVSAEIEELRQQRAKVTEEAEAQQVERKAAGQARRRAAKAQKRRAAKLARGRRQPDDVPKRQLDADGLRAELAVLESRMREIEAALATAGDEQPGDDHLDEARAAAQPTADGEPAGETEKPLPTGKAEKRDRRAARRRPDGERTRKPGKRSDAGARAEVPTPESPTDGEQTGGAPD